MKILCLAFLCLAIAHIPERDANQQALKGAWAFNELPEPQTVSDCGDDDVQIQIFTFVGPFLDKADKAGVTQVLQLEKELTAFINSLPLPYRECLQQNPEVQEISALYGITATTTEDEIRQKIINYTLGHFIGVKKVIHSANLHWNEDKNYYQTGFELAELGKKALTSSMMME